MFVYHRNNKTPAFSLSFLIFRLSKDLGSSFKFAAIGQTIAQLEFSDYFSSYDHGLENHER